MRFSRSPMCLASFCVESLSCFTMSWASRCCRCALRRSVVCVRSWFSSASLSFSKVLQRSRSSSSSFCTSFCLPRSFSSLPCRSSTCCLSLADCSASCASSVAAPDCPAIIAAVCAAACESAALSISSRSDSIAAFIALCFSFLSASCFLSLTTSVSSTWLGFLPSAFLSSPFRRTTSSRSFCIFVSESLSAASCSSCCRFSVSNSAFSA
mmetsp:Transcript_56541/g.91513  ORF Transcript_56541/g.91513 Transcript_56541/m.91513 type:complete len:210 (+) Transcript_56541:2343-2972(+)